MTIHAQEGKSYANCLKQSWNTSRILIQEKTKPPKPTKSTNKEATSNLPVPIGELVSKVIQLVEVGLAELEPVKAVTAADKIRGSVASRFGELVRAPFKNQQNIAESTHKPKFRPRPKGKNTRSTKDKSIQPQAAQATICTPEKTKPRTHKQFHPHLAGSGNSHQALRMRNLPATNRLLWMRQTSVTRYLSLTFPC
jgi:hypothetical protein